MQSVSRRQIGTAGFDPIAERSDAEDGGAQPRCVTPTREEK
jgi:hypothetical protein